MNESLFPRGLALTVLVLLPAVAAAAEFHVRPDGTPAGDGSADRPWDLHTALGHPPAVRPGDTIWVHGGTYRGYFESKLTGAEGKPVVLRAAPGERATIDMRGEEGSGRPNGMQVNGAWADYWGLEICCLEENRVSQDPSQWPADIRINQLNCAGPNVSFINVVVHDALEGFGSWVGHEGGEIYGCIIYNNGYLGTRRGHGHAIYAQNKGEGEAGVRRIVDNVMFNQFGYGLHAYGSEKAFLIGFHVEGNVSFNNGLLAGPDAGTNDMLVGGGTPADRITVVNNYTYGAGSRFGYSPDARNGSLMVKDNYFVGPVGVRYWDEIEFSGNTVVARHDLVLLDLLAGNDPGRYTFAGNTYLRTSQEWQAFTVIREGKHMPTTFEQWQGVGLDRAADGSTYAEAQPSGVKVFVRPNRYEKGRAHVVVYNWDEKDSVEVDLTGVIERGRKFRVVSAQNFYGDTVLEGTFDGKPVLLPMNHGVPPATPHGNAPFPPQVTEPRFGVFVVLPAADGRVERAR